MHLPREILAATAVDPAPKPTARTDGVGIWWITFAAVWTLLLLGGMTFLYRKRNTPTLRLRGLSLTFAGIVLLHLYWLVVQIAYTVGPLAPAVAEYWIMGVWYPFGIALFQAGNSQFLYVARAQSRFARPPSQMKTRFDEKRAVGKQTWLQRLRQMDYSKRMFMLVTIGMAVQLIVVVIVYMISRKFHADFGIPGTEVTGSSPMEIAVEQGRGWEWWPSIVWQFVWAWVVAPIVLWRSRGIHDTHGWQIQTIACCLAGLPAAPMWLIALYVPGMAPVNQYFVPPQWIATTVFIMEIFTVFVPCWQVLKHQSLRQETLESIANWESKKRFGAQSETSSDKSSAPPLSPTSTKVGDYSGFESWKKLPNLEANTPPQSSTGLPDESVLTMAALEHVLEKNPEPLRQFSARRDFSGENIAFLTAVAEWKAALPADFTRSRQDATPDSVRQQFTRALRIYTEFISPRDAEFPINIAWSDLRKLQGVFERAARTADADPSSPTSPTVDAVTPFADATAAIPALNNPGRPSADSELHILEPSTPTTKEPHAQGFKETAIPLTITTFSPASAADMSPYPLYAGDIPPSFDASVFDAAQASIKYLVLTNTWPKYVRERRSSESSHSSFSSSNGSGSEAGRLHGVGSQKGTDSSSSSAGGRSRKGVGGGGVASTVGGRSVGSKGGSLRGAFGFLRGVVA